MVKRQAEKSTFWRKWYYGNVVFATGKQRQRQGGNWGNWSGMRGSVGGKMIPCKHWNPRKKRKRKSEQLCKDHDGHFAFCKWCQWEFDKNRNCPEGHAIIGSLATSNAAVTWDCHCFVQDFFRFSISLCSCPSEMVTPDRLSGQVIAGQGYLLARCCISSI